MMDTSIAGDLFIKAFVVREIKCSILIIITSIKIRNILFFFSVESYVTEYGPWS